MALAAAAPVAADATVALIQVFPTTAPQDQATTDLLFHLREDVIPQATADSGAKAYVGGFQAVTVDFTQVLADALPWFLLIVVGFGFLALVVLFRSILVPATGVLSSLLSLAAALGITVAVFQWGWFANLIKLESTGPIFPFLPVMVFAILFGLSCDYQVFLVSRMHEEWVNTADNRKAVRRGLAGSGRVVAIAAAIMTSVFGAFVLGNDADHQAVRRRAVDGRAARRVHRPADPHPVADDDLRRGQLVAARLARPGPAARQRRVRGGHRGRGRRDRRRRGAGRGHRAGSGLTFRGPAQKLVTTDSPCCWNVVIASSSAGTSSREILEPTSRPGSRRPAATSATSAG